MNSLLELRIEAARLSIESGAKREDIIETAKNIENYIKGDVDLPETYNPNDFFKKSMEAIKNTYKDKNEDEEKESNTGKEEKATTHC